MPNSGKEKQDLKGVYDAESSFLNSVLAVPKNRDRKKSEKALAAQEAKPQAVESKKVDDAQAAADMMFSTDDVFADGVYAEQIQFEDRGATGKNKKGKKTRKKNKKGKKTRRKNKKGKKTRRRRR
tara:strand:- start:3658 stop:4032 length:375 start_codon:yes stop_codon:yes gene_type:complete